MHKSIIILQFTVSFLTSQSQEWYDSPEAIRYAQFDKEAHPDERIPSVEEVPSSVLESKQQQHILNVGMREIQDAIQDLNITRQVSTFLSCLLWNGISSLKRFPVAGSQEGDICCV